MNKIFGVRKEIAMANFNTGKHHSLGYVNGSLYYGLMEVLLGMPDKNNTNHGLTTYFLTNTSFCLRLIRQVLTRSHALS